MVAKRLTGGAASLARIVGRDRTSVSRWDGDIPTTEMIRRLLCHARAHGLPLLERHLIWGAAEDELAAICQSDAAVALRRAGRRRAGVAQ